MKKFVCGADLFHVYVIAPSRHRLAGRGMGARKDANGSLLETNRGRQRTKHRQFQTRNGLLAAGQTKKKIPSLIVAKVTSNVSSRFKLQSLAGG